MPVTALFVPRERAPGERRVAATPETVGRFVADGFDVLVETGAGALARHGDEAYREAGARVLDGTAEGWTAADVAVTVGPPVATADADPAALLRKGALVVGLLAPHRNLGIVRTLVERGVSAVSMELIPRTSRAQKMDALSSQANLAGYRAAVYGATLTEKPFPLYMTAAGTVRPATVVVLGAGVAGLQAVATARRLGARVRVSDIREAAKAESESLGAEFIELDATGDQEGEGGYARAVGEDFLTMQRRVLARELAAADLVLSTAFVPGRPAPVLITEEMVAGMKPGSAIVDIAAAEGGNCALTVAGEVVDHDGVKIAGAALLPADMPAETSALYARNVREVVTALLDGDGGLQVDPEHTEVGPALIVHDGAVRHEPTAALLAKGDD